MCLIMGGWWSDGGPSDRGKVRGSFFGRTEGDYLGGWWSDGGRSDRGKVRGSFFWSDGWADGGQKEK